MKERTNEWTSEWTTLSSGTVERGGGGGGRRYERLEGADSVEIGT